MLINKFISCRTCNEVINIRIQAEDNRIPFIVNCPKCSTEISVEIDLSKSGELKAKNASELLEAPNLPLWCVELSAVLPVKKMYLRNSLKLEYGLSPFMNTMNLLGVNGFEVFTNVMRRITALNERAQKGLFEDFLRVNTLLMNDNNDYIVKETKELLKNISEYTDIKEVNNLLDGIMVLHQNLIASGISVLLEDNALKKYTQISKVILHSLDKKQLLDYYSKYKNNIRYVENKAFSLVSDFSEIVPQLSPVVLLIAADKYEEIDQEKYGISSAIYCDLKQFYAKSYEWLLDALDIVIALNNISVRRNYSKCVKDRDFDSDLPMLSNKYDKIKMYISDTEPFSNPLTNINNRVRNAIQHYSDEIDYVSQRISFIDRYRGETKSIEISLMDFAKLCLENFSWIIYIMELIYNLQKFELIFVKDLEPSTLVTKPREKIGRNEPCPCGSGKKYKKCCGK